MERERSQHESESDELAVVLQSAARLQALLPDDDVVLVGGSAAALYAGHRLSRDHDHVLADLNVRFDIVLEALESEGDWVTNRVVPGKIILGALGDIEAGVRQLIRKRPLEHQRIRLPSGDFLTVPTVDEILRIKAFLAVRRNQTRDYLDIAALSDLVGTAHAGRTLAGIDEFYGDQVGDGDAVATQVQSQLADPRPRDAAVSQELATYKNIDPQWHSWSAVRDECRLVAAAMLADLDLSEDKTDR